VDIQFSTIINVETMLRLESFIEKARETANPGEIKMINKAGITNQAINEYLERVEKEL